MSGAFTSSVNLCSASNISLFELNVDRRTDLATIEDRTIGPKWDIPGIDVPDGVSDTGLIYPFLYKDGTRMNFRVNTAESFASAPAGQVITGAAYPYTASITKEFYGPWTGAPRDLTENAAGNPIGTMGSLTFLDICQTPRFTESYRPPGGGLVVNGTVSHLRSLKNVINRYKTFSPHFEYRSTSGSYLQNIHDRNFDSASVGLISIPSIFYGSSIKRGTVNLEFYFTGTLVGQAQDINRNGELIEVYSGYRHPDVENLSGSVVGIVLYEDGIILLTSSAALSPSVDNYTGSVYPSPHPNAGDPSKDNPRWTYFAQSLSAAADPAGDPDYPRVNGFIAAPSSSFIMEFSGTTKTQVFTMFATAPVGELNHSNNPSYIKNSWYQSSYTASISTGSKGYIESDMKPIKNVVSSAYADPTGSFEKTTYISKVAIYDEHRNLIGIAKTATPIKKTVQRSFTFKLKLDI